MSCLQIFKNLSGLYVYLQKVRNTVYLPFSKGGLYL